MSISASGRTGSSSQASTQSQTSTAQAATPFSDGNTYVSAIAVAKHPQFACPLHSHTFDERLMLLCPVASLRMSKLPPEQEQAYERTQKYKEGKFIIEKAKIMKDGRW